MTAIRDALRAIIDTLDAEEMGEGPPASGHVAHWQKLHDDGTAALAALDAETEGWRTMDSAPKDGTTFLAYDGYHLFLCKWNHDRHCWWDFSSQILPTYYHPSRIPSPPESRS